MHARLQTMTYFSKLKVGAYLCTREEWQGVQIVRWWIERIYLMAYQTKLIKEGSWQSLQNLSSVFTFKSRCGDRSTLMVDWMSLYVGLLSQIHWRKFVTHLCITFSIFSHSYQSVVTKWGSERIPWRMLISRPNLCEVYIHFLNPQWDFAEQKPRKYILLLI